MQYDNIILLLSIAYSIYRVSKNIQVTAVNRCVVKLICNTHFLFPHFYNRFFPQLLRLTTALLISFTPDHSLLRIMVGMIGRDDPLQDMDDFFFRPALLKGIDLLMKPGFIDFFHLCRKDLFVSGLPRSFCLGQQFFIQLFAGRMPVICMGMSTPGS